MLCNYIRRSPVENSVFYRKAECKVRRPITLFATGELCFALSLSLLLRKIQLPPGGSLNVGVDVLGDPYDVFEKIRTAGISFIQLAQTILFSENVPS